MGETAYRRMGKHRSGRPKKVSDELMNERLDPQRNPVRDQLYEVQMEHFHINAKRRCLQRAFHTRRPRVSRFKKARIRNSVKWISSSAFNTERIMSIIQLMIIGSTFILLILIPIKGSKNECFEKRALDTSPKICKRCLTWRGFNLHVAASISWHHKGALQFYNDEHDLPHIQIKKSRKPRKPRMTKAMTDEQYQQKGAEWEASLSHDVDIKPQGNSMTQAYYTQRLLPVYIKEIHECRVSFDRSCIFQEHNDPSHGTRSADNIVCRCKSVNWIDTLIHPPQSPDLNSSEGVWNILKQRVRRRRYSNVTELKRVILEVWDEISMEEIRARIREMPDRCKKLAASNGDAIKSDLWWCRVEI